MSSVHIIVLHTSPSYMYARVCRRRHARLKEQDPGGTEVCIVATAVINSCSKAIIMKVDLGQVAMRNFHLVSNLEVSIKVKRSHSQDTVHMLPL